MGSACSSATTPLSPTMAAPPGQASAEACNQRFQPSPMNRNLSGTTVSPRNGQKATNKQPISTLSKPSPKRSPKFLAMLTSSGSNRSLFDSPTATITKSTIDLFNSFTASLSDEQTDSTLQKNSVKKKKNEVQPAVCPEEANDFSSSLHPHNTYANSEGTNRRSSSSMVSIKQIAATSRKSALISIGLDECENDSRLLGFTLQALDRLLKEFPQAAQREPLRNLQTLERHNGETLRGWISATRKACETSEHHNQCASCTGKRCRQKAPKSLDCGIRPATVYVIELQDLTLEELREGLLDWAKSKKGNNSTPVFWLPSLCGQEVDDTALRAQPSMLSWYTTSRLESRNESQVDLQSIEAASADLISKAHVGNSKSRKSLEGERHINIGDEIMCFSKTKANTVRWGFEDDASPRNSSSEQEGTENSDQNQKSSKPLQAVKDVPTTASTESPELRQQENAHGRETFAHESTDDLLTNTDISSFEIQNMRTALCLVREPKSFLHELESSSDLVEQCKTALVNDCSVNFHVHSNKRDILAKKPSEPFWEEFNHHIAKISSADRKHSNVSVLKWKYMTDLSLTMHEDLLHRGVGAYLAKSSTPLKIACALHKLGRMIKARTLLEGFLNSQALHGMYSIFQDEQSQATIVAEASLELGQIQFMQGNLEFALENLLSAQDILKQAKCCNKDTNCTSETDEDKDAGNRDAENNATTLLQILTTRCERYIGLVYHTMGNFSKAKKSLENCVTDSFRTLGGEHIETLHAKSVFGTVLFDIGMLPQAMDMWHEAHEGLSKINGSQSFVVLGILQNIGSGFRASGQHEDALNAFNSAMCGYDKTVGHFHSETLNCLAQILHLYRERKDMDSIISVLTTFISARQQTEMDKVSDSSMPLWRDVLRFGISTANKVLKTDVLDESRELLAQRCKSLCLTHFSFT